MLMGDFKCHLKIAENYQKEADRALNSLQSELINYLITEGVVHTVVGAGVGVTAGAGD